MTRVPTESVIDLLAMLAYGEVLAFDRMAVDARLAPDLRRRALLSEAAGAEIAHYRRLVDRLEELGTDPEQAMAPFAGALEAYHDLTRPRDWPEAVVKAYVGDRLTDDFVRTVAGVLGRRDRELVSEVVQEGRYQRLAADELRALTADEQARSRLSMWARRLVGEAMAQAMRIATERPALTALVVAVNGDANGDQSAVQLLLRRLAQAHTQRMSEVGLNS